MKTSMFYFTIFFSIISGNIKAQEINNNCKCDFDYISSKIDADSTKYKFFTSTIIINSKNFYKLSKRKNKQFWFYDIESPKPTELTPYWNSYEKNNYNVSLKDFIKKYSKDKNVTMAFNIGPTLDLWAYTLFVVKKIDNCYLITRSYFRHGRFTNKSYSIISECQLKTLKTLLSKVNRIIEVPKGKDLDWEIDTCVIDNTSNEVYFPKMYDKVEKTDLLNGKMQTFGTEELNSKMKLFLDYLYDSLEWVRTHN